MNFDDHRIGKNFTELHYEAMGCVGDYLRNAVEKIDDELGDGYAKKHPELVGAMVIATQQEFFGSQLSKALGGAIEAAGSLISEGIHGQACSIETASEKLETIADRI